MQGYFSFSRSARRPAQSCRVSLCCFNRDLCRDDDGSSDPTVQGRETISAASIGGTQTRAQIGLQRERCRVEKLELSEESKVAEGAADGESTHSERPLNQPSQYISQDSAEETHLDGVARLGQGVGDESTGAEVGRDVVCGASATVPTTVELELTLLTSNVPEVVTLVLAKIHTDDESRVERRIDARGEGKEPELKVLREVYTAAVGERQRQFERRERVPYRSRPSDAGCPSCSRPCRTRPYGK